ncbi:MAG: hypothetical protein ACRDP4_15985 [Nocardioidaceae bacterium]
MAERKDHRAPSGQELLAAANRDAKIGVSGSASGASQRLRTVLTDRKRQPMVAWLIVAVVLVGVGAAALGAAASSTYHGAPCGNLSEWYADQQAGMLNHLPKGFPSLHTAANRCEAIVAPKVRWGGTLLLLAALAAWLSWVARPPRREHLVAACGFVAALLLLSVPVVHTHAVRGSDAETATSCGSVLWPGPEPQNSACSPERDRRGAWSGVVAAATVLVAVAVRRSRREKEQRGRPGRP